MALSDNEIIRAIKTQELRIVPGPRKINPAGIDLRTDRRIIMDAKHHDLVATKERVELSHGLLGLLHIRSSFAREGIIASLALVDPGFRGQLTVNLYNAGDRRVILKAGERFIQLSLVRLGNPANYSYNGKYQDSTGVVKSRRGNFHGVISRKPVRGLE
jgi:dCTP deaminase